MTVNLTWVEVIGNDIQGAVNSLPAGGGTVYMPGRDYSVTGSVTINKPNVTILGDGPGEIGLPAPPPARGTLVFCPNGASFPIFKIEKSYCTIDGLRMTQGGIPVGGTGVGIQIGSASEIITGTILKNLLLDSLPSYAISLPGVSFGSFQEVNETLVERVTITHGRKVGIGNVFIGRGNTLATFRNCTITPYITGAPAAVPGIVIENAANIVFDSCEGNANPGSVWLDFRSTGDFTDDVFGGESCSIINCDVEINKEALETPHNGYFIVMKGVSHPVLRNNLFYFSTKGVRLENCYQALLEENLFKDIRSSGTANPSPLSLTLDACRQTTLINNSWENPDTLAPGESLPPGTVEGQRMALPFEEINATTGTTVSAQGTFRPPTYASVEGSVVPNAITNPLLTGMLATIRR